VGHWALGIGHWALGIGHWALGIGDGKLNQVKPRDVINRRQDEGLIIVETAIYRVFVI
jgi:hypothetical protein